MRWGHGGRIRQLVLVLLLMSGVVGIGYILAMRRVIPVAIDDPYTPILRQYTWAPRGAPSVLSVTVPPAEELPTATGPPWALYLELSREIGLDFTPYAGQTLPLRVYRLGRDPAVRGFLLIGDERVVGAWLDVEQGAPGLYPLNTNPQTLAP